MSAPFGGHPTLRRFLEYAGENGCTVRTVVRSTRKGMSYESLEITNPEGGRVAIPNPDFDERLVPSMVSFYQRRLGIRTPFASQPEQPQAAQTTYVTDNGSPIPSEGHESHE